MQRVALGLGGVLITLALGLGIPALLEHARERAAWAAERAEQGTDAYDPAESDRHYRASRDAWQRSGPVGHLFGVGALLFALGAVRRRDRRSGTDSDADSRQPNADDREPNADDREPNADLDPGRLHVAAACAIDAALGAAFLALHWLDAGESAAIRALASAAPWLAALPFAPLIAGTSPGLRLTGLRTDGGARALVAIALWPLAALGGLHFRVAGLAVERERAFAES
ncbi:MAG: hypothetical protein JJ863_20595 [Deltaproteobacteria bacterium]|nr:hypothetical protein [Deltaproteobacteria bacterium]